MERSDYIFGIRAVMEAIEAGKDIDKVLIKKDFTGELSSELMNLLNDRKIYVQKVPVERINRITRKNHQGVLAFVSSVTYYSLENIVPELYEQGALPFMVVLDGVTDVRNFGAIARTAECAGVDAIVIPEKNSASVNGDAIKTSAGALHHIPVCREKSLYNAVKFLKDNGYLIIGSMDRGAVNYTTIDYTVPVALILGAEDTGISPEILRLCDAYAKIPEFGKINSLNVSVAGGVLMYEVVRQRMNANLEAK